MSSCWPILKVARPIQLWLEDSVCKALSCLEGCIGHNRFILLPTPHIIFPWLLKQRSVFVTVNGRISYLIFFVFEALAGGWTRTKVLPIVCRSPWKTENIVCRSSFLGVVESFFINIKINLKELHLDNCFLSFCDVQVLTGKICFV